MPSYFWSQKSVVETLLQADFMLKRLNLQGRFANRSDVAEVACLLENILASAPVQDDKNAKTVRTIIDVLQNIIRKDPHGEMMDAQNLSTAETKNMGKQSSQLSEEASPQAKGPREEFDSFASARTKAIEDTIVPDADNFPSFKEIAGLHEAKTAMLEALVDPIRYPEYFKAGDLKPWKSVLLYGPPGTGKTILSQAIAKEISGVLYQISSTDLISSWQGQSEKLIKELFDHAFTQKKAVVIFIDEVDSLCRVRSRTEDDSNRRVKTELLVQIQRLQSTTNLILICATNCPWELDPAFLRRLEKRIYAGLPDFEARHEILKAKLKSTVFDPSVGLNFLAQQSDGFSGDDLRRLASELAYAQFRKYKNTSGSRQSGSQITVSSDDVHQVLEKFQPSVDSHQLALYEQFMTRR